MDKDVITVKAENDSGQTVDIAVVKISGDTVELYHPGDGSASVTDNGVTVAGSGYFNIWLHHMQTGPAYITDLCAEGSVGGDKKTEAANMYNSKDVLSDTWISTDDEGRLTETGTGVPSDKKVGIFYFLWHDVNIHGGNGKLYDHTKAYYSGGEEELIKTITSGPLGFAHYWAEPYFVFRLLQIGRRVGHKKTHVSACFRRY